MANPLLDAGTTTKRTWKLTREGRAEVVRRYIAGESVAALGREHGLDPSGLYRLLARRGVALRGSPATPPEKVATILDRYVSGESGCKIARSLGMDKSTVRNILRRSGHQMRRPKLAHRSYTLNDAAFDVLTPEAAYWVGFLMADGCVTKPSKLPTASWRIAVALQAADAGHLQRFATFLGTNKPIRFADVRTPTGKSVRAARLYVCSDQLAAALSRYGVVPRKSATATVVGLEDSRDFWRGLIDGDGTVATAKINGYQYPTLHLNGSEPITRQFEQYVRSLCPDVTARARRGSTCWKYAVTGKAARVVIGNLYQPGDVSLIRKANAAARLVQTEVGQ